MILMPMILGSFEVCYDTWPARLSRLALVPIAVFLAGCDARDGKSNPDGEATRSTATVAQTAGGALGQGVVYTTNEDGRSITRLDLSSGTTANISLGIVPHNVQISPDGRTIFLVGSATMNMTDEIEHSANDAPGVLMILPADASDTSDTVRIVVGRSPAHVVVDPAGRRAFITNSADNSVIAVDRDSGRRIATIQTPAFPHGLRMSPDGRELYVACVNAGIVSVIDTRALREVGRIPVGRAPVQVGFLPDGRTAYVSLRDENAVAVIDVGTRRVTTRISVGRAPIQLFATPDGRFVYVANQGSKEAPDSTVSVIDTKRNAVDTSLIAGRGAHGVVLSTDGTRAFVSNTFVNTVTVIDVARRRVLRNVAVGEGPSGITYRP